MEAGLQSRYKIGDILRSYKDIHGRKARDIAESFLDDAIYFRTEKFLSCCLCEREEWVSTSTMQSNPDEGSWEICSLTLLPHIWYCPDHTSLRRELDFTLEHTLKAEALQIVKGVASRMKSN